MESDSPLVDVLQVSLLVVIRHGVFLMRIISEMAKGVRKGGERKERQKVEKTLVPMD